MVYIYIYICIHTYTYIHVYSTARAQELVSKGSRKGGAEKVRRRVSAESMHRMLTESPPASQIVLGAPKSTASSSIRIRAQQSMRASPLELEFEVRRSPRDVLVNIREQRLAEFTTPCS